MSTTGIPIATRGFDFVLIQSTDVPRLRGFYESLFGLKATLEYDVFYVEYDLPDGNTLAIGRDPAATEFIPTGGMVFGVDDAEAARARIEALGGAFIKNYGGETCSSAWCRDPDGNYFGVHQRK